MAKNLIPHRHTLSRVPRTIRQLIAARACIGLVMLTLSSALSGCGQISGAVSGWVALPDTSISGSVLTFDSSSSSSSTSSTSSAIQSTSLVTPPSVRSSNTTLSCPSVKAELFELSTAGAIVEPALATTAVDADGNYKFSGLAALGVKTFETDILGSYLVRISGCNTIFNRIVTSTREQDVSFGTALISSLVNSANASALSRSNKTPLQDLLKALSKASSYQQAYKSLSQDTRLSAVFEATFGGPPNILLDIPPTPINISVPTVAREGQALPLSITANHWNTDFDSAYVWKIDGVTVATSNTVSLTLSANWQGQRTVSVTYGQINSAGTALDTTKPFGSKSFPIQISNDIPVSVPQFSLVGSSLIGSSSVPLRITTGAAVSGGSPTNCESLSKLAITEDSAIAPSSSSLFTISCTDSPTQDLTYTLSGGPGAHTLYLWAIDSSGNIASVPQSVSLTYSNSTPVILITSPNNSTPLQASVTISGTCDVTAGDVSVSGDISSSPITTACSSGSFSYAAILSGVDGAKTVQAAQTNSFGNTGSDSITLTKDTTLPTVTLASTAASITNAAVPIIVTFSEPVTGFTSSDLTIVNGTVSSFTGSGASYSFTVTPTSQGAVSVDLASGVAADLAGNLNTVASTLSRTYDSVVPTVTLASTASSITNTTPVPVTVTFSESVTGFTSADFSLTNATVSNFSGSGATYSFDLAPAGQGAVSVTVNAAAAVDVGGNANTISSALTRTYDSVAPSVTISTTANDPTSASPIPVVITFSESVTGFASGDITVSGGSISSFTGSGANYSFDFTPSSNTTVTVAIAGSAAQDSAGNNNTAATTLSRVFNSNQPSVTIATTAPSATKNSPIPVTVTFSSSVTGFDANDITKSNATVSNFAGSGTSYSFDLTPSGQGVVTAHLASGVAQDFATSVNLPSNTLSVVYDTVAPVLAFTAPAPSSYVNASNVSSVTVSGTCTEDGSVQLAVSTVTQTVSCSAGSYSTTLDLSSLADGALMLTQDMTDAATNAATQVTRSLTKDILAPTAILSGTPSTPSLVTTLNVTVGGTGVTHYKYKVGASASVDCTASAGYSSETAIATLISNDISGLSDGAIKLCVVGRDAANNYQADASATSYIWTKDTTVTVFSSLAITPVSPGNDTTPTLSGVSEASSVVQMYSLGSCIGSVLASSTAAGDGTFSVTPGSSIGADGSYGFSFLSTDVAGNTRCSSTVAYTLHTASPTVTLSTTSPSPTNAASISVTATFSDAVTGFTAGDLTVTNSTISAFSGSGTTYTFILTPTAEGAFTALANASGAVDSAQNGNAISNTLSVTRDTVMPTPLAWVSPAANTTAQDQLAITGTCEDGTSLTFMGSGILSSIATTCSGGTFARTIFFSTSDGNKTITLRQTDLAGNQLDVSRVFARDTAAPTITQTAQNNPYHSATSTAILGGSCEAGLSIAISGAATDTTTCTAGTWAWTTPSVASDASRLYTLTQIDAAGNEGVFTVQWVRDTVVPTMAFSSTQNWITASDAVTFTGSCETGLLVTVAGGTDTSTATCNASSFSYTTVTRATDTTRTYTFQQTDLAGNQTTITGTWQRITSGPVFTITGSDRVINNLGSATFSGACNSSFPIDVTGSATATLTCVSGAWSYTPTAGTDGSRSYTLSQTNAVPLSTTLTVTWIRDTVVPVISSLNLNASATTTTSPVVLTSLSATDSLTKIQDFCLRLDATTPIATDSCWVNVASNPPGLTPSTTLNLSNYNYALGLTASVYTVRAWVRDEASNISTFAAQNGVDQQSITYSPGNDPVISFVWVNRTDTPNSPPNTSDQTISAGQNVYIKWRTTDADASGLSANPISISVTYDNTNWITVASNLVNGSNGGCTPDGSSTLDDSATGCFIFSSPTSDFFQIRVRAIDADGRQAQRLGNATNTSPMRIIAGNMDRGLNSSAASAVFPYIESGDANLTETGSFVVTDSNDVYIADARNGLLQIKASDGILRRFIPATGTTTTGSVANATLNFPLKVALEHTGDLLIFDYDRILRLNIASQTLTRIIGAGASTANTIANPLDLLITALSKVTNSVQTLADAHHRHTLIPLPDGRIIFRTIHSGGTDRRIAVYDPNASNKIIQNLPTGNVRTGGGTASQLNECDLYGFAVAYNTSTSAISRFMVNNRSRTSGNCTPSAESGISYLDPTTFVALSSPTPVQPTSAPWTTTAAQSFQLKMLSGNDGNIYLSRRLSGSILRFDAQNNTYVNVLGTGATGSCADGTAATSCATEVRDFWVNREGRVYWWERSRLRTLNDANQVVTIYGQSLGFGDGGSPLLARFANIESFDRSDAGELVIGDIQEFTLRVVNSAGTLIQKLAGLGTGSGYVANNSSALTSPTLMTSSRYTVVLDRSTGEPITSGNTNIVKLDRSASPNRWQSIGLFLSTGTLYSVADGLDGANIRMGQDSGGSAIGHSIPIAWSSAGLVTINQNRQPSSARNDVMFKFYQHADRIQSNILGGLGAGANLCQPTAGTPIAATSCFYPASDNNTNPLRPIWDSTASRWIIGQRGRTNLVAANGTDVEHLITLPRAYRTFTYHRDAINRFVLYCDSTNGRLYKYDLNASSNHETLLTWTIPGAQCTGGDIHYDSANNVAYTVVTRDSLYGIVEVVIP